MLKEVAQETYLQLKQILGESIDGPSSPPPQPPPPPSCNVATVQNDILALLVTIKNCTVSFCILINSQSVDLFFFLRMLLVENRGLILGNCHQWYD